MILTHIVAEDVLKYRRLELRALPSQGLITICGQNESGKSTIGETVCFALFGRTFSVGEDELQRVIRWGESRCNVKLGFAANGTYYELARFLDDEGNHAARIYHADDADKVIAKGVEAVGRTLDTLLGYQFEEFVESFYLAQREITTPHPHSHTVKTMAGISALEKVAKSLASEKAEAEDDIPVAKAELEAVEVDIAGLAIDGEKLSALQGEAKELADGGMLLRERDSGLTAALKDYRSSLPQLRSTKIIGAFGWGLCVAGLVTSILSGAAWLLLTQAPAAEIAVQLREWIEGRWAGKPSLLGIAAGIAAVIALAAWALSHLLGRKSATLRESGIALAYQIRSGEENVAGLDSPFDESKCTSEEELNAIRLCRLDADSAEAVIEKTRTEIAGRLVKQQSMSEELGVSIDNEQARHDKAVSLEHVASEIKRKLVEGETRVKERELAAELIQSSARHISQRFNKDLRELASGTLPLFTEGRYEHLQIDSDLTVKVFSNLKRDFMDLEEISSGTGRQIMLAVRLALSQELAKTTSSGSQFIFLDEPFAFFDPVRTRNAMEVLPKISEELSQIWVIAQEFPEGSQAALAIDCSREFEELIL